MAATKSCFHLDIGRLTEFAEAVEQDPERAKFTFATTTTWRDGAVTETRARGNGMSTWPQIAATFSASTSR